MKISRFIIFVEYFEGINYVLIDKGGCYSEDMGILYVYGWSL